MEQDQKGNSNILQFPGKRKDSENVESPPASTVVNSRTAEGKRASKSNKTLSAAIIAVVLLTVAFNRLSFSSGSNSMEVASHNSEGRAIASVERLSWERDSKWEKQLAEQLASSRVRVPSAFGIGRAATAEEKLRWGLLEEKYAIAYNEGRLQIRSILLQDLKGEPATVADRAQFLNEYGLLFEASYSSAKLKAVEASAQNTVESYTVFGRDNQPKGEVRIELDQQNRLISLKVEPVKI